MKNNTKDFLLYLIVGAIATAAEWVFFFIFDKFSFHYSLSTILAYILSTLFNWLAGRLLVFKKGTASLLKEILGIYIAAGVGLLLNLAIMWVGVDLLSINKMLTKISATGIVFIYNFLVRKLFIYKQK